MERPAIGIVAAYPDTVVAMLEASCSLRMVALRLAVNPIHAGLVERAGGTGFSLINAIVYVA
jgi:hypothetical protein